MNVFSDYQEWINRAVTWFVIIDPVGTLPLFIALTRHLSVQDRKKVARKSIFIAAAVLLSYVVVGQILLNAIGVSVEAFRLAGGIILFLLGLRMVFENTAPTSSAHPEPGHDIAVFPLAIPSIAGPGAVMAAIVMTDETQFSFAEQAATVGLMLGVLAITYLFFIFATKIQRWIGDTGGNVISRVMGMILCALAAQSSIDAIQAMLKN